MPVREYPHFKVRVPPDLKAWIERQAEMNHRSLTGEVVHRLEQSRIDAENKSRSAVTSDGMSATGGA